MHGAITGSYTRGGPAGTSGQRSSHTRGTSRRWQWFREASDPFRMVLAAIILIDISRIHQQFGFIGAIRPALLAFLVGVGLAVLQPKYMDWKNLTRTWHPKAVVVLACIGMASGLFGLSMGQSGTFFLDVYSKVLVSAFLILAGLRSPEHLKLIVWTYVLSCAIWVLMAFTVFDLETTTGGQARLADLHSFDANDLGLVLVVGIPMILWLTHGSRVMTRLFLVSVILGIGATIALTGSRGALVGLAATALALVYLSRHVGIVTRAGVVGVLVAGLLISAPPGYWQQMNTILSPEDDYNLTGEEGRKAIALRGLSYMKAYPIFGVGMSNFGRAEAFIGRAEDQRDGIGVAWLAPHNTYVQVGAEMGFFALMIWLSLLGAGIFGLVRLRNRLPRQWLRGSPRQQFLYAGTVFLPASFVAFAVCSVFLSFAYLTPMYLLIAMMTTLHIQSNVELRQWAGPGTSESRVPRSVRAGGARSPRSIRRGPSGVSPAGPDGVR